MLTPARPGGRRRWALVAGGLGLAGLIVVTAVVALSSKDPAASHAVTTMPTDTSGLATSGTAQSISPSSSVMLPGGRPDSMLLGGQTDHLMFARLVAQSLLAYAPSTDFDARNQDLLHASAPAPYGDEAR